MSGGLFGLLSQRHCRRGRFRSPGHSSSIFLEPFAPPALPGFVTTMAPLTPAGPLSGARQVSLLHVLDLPVVPSPITLRCFDHVACLFCTERTAGDVPRNAPHPLHGHAGVSWASPLGSGLAVNGRPYRVRHPTDRSFTSGCSPPPLTRTQFPSVTEPGRPLTGTPTLLIQYTRNRTAPRREPGGPRAIGRETSPEARCPFTTKSPNPFSTNTTPQATSPRQTYGQLPAVPPACAGGFYGAAPSK